MQAVDLALDASTDLLSVALRLGTGELLCTQGARSEHPGGIAQVVTELCVSRDVSFEGLRRVVLGGGPGSFTGVRATLAFATGLAAAAELEILMLPSLVAGASFNPSSPHTIVLLSAGRGEFFVARARWQLSAWNFEISETPISSDQLRHDLTGSGGAKVVVMGEGMSCDLSLPLEQVTSSADRLLIAADMLSAGTLQVPRQYAKNAIESSQLTPWYVRRVAARSLAERSAGTRTPD